MKNRSANRLIALRHRQPGDRLAVKLRFGIDWAHAATKRGSQRRLRIGFYLSVPLNCTVCVRLLRVRGD